jgi:desulfoferrodoxin-like iron-binding protein
MIYEVPPVVKPPAGMQTSYACRSWTLFTIRRIDYQYLRPEATGRCFVLANQDFAILTCQKCGTIIRVLRGGQGTVVCCGAPMNQVNRLS